MDEIRAFIAIELSTDILRQLENLQARMKQNVPSGLVRWTRPEGIHLTLKFLGEVPADQTEAIADAMRRACAPYTPFSLSVAGVGCFPNPQRPRVVWVGIDEPTGALAGLQRDIERAMKPLGFAPENRAFTPHLTLGRVKGGRRDELEALGTYACSCVVQATAQEVTAVSLMRSDLRPSGAVYTELASAPLVGAR
jgi:2'-5' RNA ligase